MLRICPVCGRSSDQVRFIGTFCVEDFARRYRLELPRRIGLLVCRACGRVRTDRWEPPSWKAVEKVVRRGVKGRFDSMRLILPEGFEGSASAVFIVEADGEFVEIPRGFELLKKSVLCEDDLRASSGYYEAIVQLRGEPARVGRMAEKLARLLRKKTFISKIEEQKSGVDLYVGSNDAVSEAVELLRLRDVQTRKLYGVKEGRRVFRVTHLIRV